MLSRIFESSDQCLVVRWVDAEQRAQFKVYGNRNLFKDAIQEISQ